MKRTTEWRVRDTSTYHPELTTNQPAVQFNQEQKAPQVREGGVQYIILVNDAGKWRDCGEGPWETLKGAEDFAEAEVGLPWKIARERENVDVKALFRAIKDSRAKVTRMARDINRILGDTENRLKKVCECGDSECPLHIVQKHYPCDCETAKAVR